MSMTFVPITLVGCATKKWKLPHDRIAQCLGYLHANFLPSHIIQYSVIQILLRKTGGVRKNVEYCTLAAIINGLHAALSAFAELLVV